MSKRKRQKRKKRKIERRREKRERERKEKSDMERKEKDEKEKEDKKEKEKERKGEGGEKENAKDKNMIQAVEKEKEVKRPIKGVNKTNKEKSNKVIIINDERNSGRKNIKLHSPTFLKLQSINTDQSQKDHFRCGRYKISYMEHLLSKMLAPNSPLKPMDGIYFFDRDSTLFRHILNFMRTSEVPYLNIRQLLNLKREASYFECERLLIKVEKRLKGEIGLEE